ncbi:hypothetical protein CapIbe_020166 [Capra ibex]
MPTALLAETWLCLSHAVASTFRSSFLDEPCTPCRQTATCWSRAESWGDVPLEDILKITAPVPCFLQLLQRC